MIRKLKKEKRYGYLSRIFRGIGSLVTGLGVTFSEFFTRKTTETYPENRDTLVMFDRFRGTLVMPHDEAGKNKCIACGLCAATCPNDTIRVETETVTDEESGKKKKTLVKYEYNLGSCLFCQLCVNVCPSDAIRFGTAFEHAVYTKEKLVKTLNEV